ncbi:hypothetical protein EVAR_97219_1 [Eumeta japonica]|uniref:Uncharacterized protein n=1 Tax=Eumeta variegata TaxID=151549 RepID=A0A4C1WJ83_EUMVA|nr:hypothetical protein EVAR_97219_1 [Eumeta japonica]
MRQIEQNFFVQQNKHRGTPYRYASNVWRNIYEVAYDAYEPLCVCSGLIHGILINPHAVVTVRAVGRDRNAKSNFCRNPEFVPEHRPLSPGTGPNVAHSVYRAESAERPEPAASGPPPNGLSPLPGKALCSRRIELHSHRHLENIYNENASV